jgi:CemA family
MSRIYDALFPIYQWYLRTPERALEKAYSAAQKIRELEVKYFEGNAIDLQTSKYRGLEKKEFNKLLKKNLNIIQERLTEFNASRAMLEFLNQPTTAAIQVNSADGEQYQYYPDAQSQFTVILEKLKFVDEVINKYKRTPTPIVPTPTSKSALTGPQMPLGGAGNMSNNPSQLRTAFEGTRSPQSRFPNSKYNRRKDDKMLEQSSVLPRSILRTLDRVKQELDPKAEEEYVEKFRSRQNKTVVSLRFLLLLILIPLLIHQVSKNFLVTPIFEHVWHPQVALFFNQDYEEEALVELNHFEERLKFEMLIGKAPELTEEEVEERVKEKANEIAEDYRGRGDNALKNIFSDLCSLGAFCIVLLVSRREVEVLKQFLDGLIYGLSDSAKAFVIILFTDMFVGFHSPHGWEVILESIARHFGLPENREFNFLFIATFPVILDTVMKYWIFRYLNRISPSAVATYHNMNE